MVGVVGDCDGGLRGAGRRVKRERERKRHGCSAFDAEGTPTRTSFPRLVSLVVKARHSIGFRVLFCVFFVSVWRCASYAEQGRPGQARARQEVCSQKSVAHRLVRHRYRYSRGYGPSSASHGHCACLDGTYCIGDAGNRVRSTPRTSRRPTTFATRLRVRRTRS